MNELLTPFYEEVVLKYHLFNGLFLTLPFGGTEEAGTLLSVFAKHCQTEINKGKNPSAIIKSFFAKNGHIQNEKDEINLLFRMMQFVERQVVLFDALEDAAFADTHNLKGRGSLHNLFIKVINNQRRQDFIKQISDYQVKIVLTAHPTQFYPYSILAILTQLGPALRNNNLKQISLLLLQMGKTSFRQRQKPTPLQEAQSLLWYLENIFYPVIPEIQAEIDHALKDFSYQGKKLTPPIGLQCSALDGITLAVTPDSSEPPPKCIELGFWPGGDRDGNPFVTAETTLEVARLLKSRILRMYIRELAQLVKKLTFEGILDPLEGIKKKVEDTFLQSQLTTAQKPNAAVYLNDTALLSDLEQLKTLLIIEHNSLFLNLLEQFITKIRCFGFYFAAMDMRETANIHREVCAALLKELAKDTHIHINPKQLQSYTQLSDIQKITVLEELIQQKITYQPPSQQSNKLLESNMLSLATIPAIQMQNGEKGLCRYIISNTSSALDLLELLALLHLTPGFKHRISVDIIPLFESITDLENCKQIMTQVYDNTTYRAHLQQRGNNQIIMLGFSDGTKDGGYVAANWSIYQAKLQLTALSKQYGIHVTFFDGRGGPPARGGGKTHAFYRSLGSKIKHRRPQLTVQGQTISTNFGTHDSAKYNIEQLLTASLEDLIFTEEANDLTDKEIELLEQLSLAGKTAYLDLKNNKLFVPYLEQMTPLKFFSELNIGSRPTTRKKTAQLRLTDLRAIPFVGSWSQLKQNIPGYYGFGSALQQLIKQGKQKALSQLYDHSLFFRTLVENTMMSLSKTYFPLTAYMKKDPEFGGFWQKLSAEAELTKKLLLKISGQTCLLEADTLNRESIKLREEIVLPLLVIQQFAMMRLKELADQDSNLSTIYKKMILKAMAANTNASRNSA